jgi:D-aminoacyl-tRNA deacylase
MRVVIQRVREASVTVNDEVSGSIKNGLLVLVGFENKDTADDIKWMGAKLINLRIFSDSEGKMNLSLNDINASLLVISQFTLFASTVKGNRPSFLKAADPEIAKTLYIDFIQYLKDMYKGRIETGIFGADMSVSLVNDGPVTIVIDTKNKE